MRKLLTIVILLPILACGVEVTKTVKPVGGGDFTTLQSALDWIKANVFTPTGAVIECYSGGSLGTAWVTSQGWFPKPSYITIRAASGNTHNGKIPTTGCYILVSAGTAGFNVAGYGWSVTTLVQRLTVITTNNASSGLAIGGDYGTRNVTFDGNLIYHVGTNKTTDAILLSQYEAGTIGPITVRNNIVYGGVTTNYRRAVYGEAYVDTAAQYYLYNNTFQRCQRGTEWYESPGFPPFVPGGTISLVEVNDMATSCRTCFTWAASSEVSSNNLSSDATADDAGGSNHKINKPASDQYINVLNDFNLKITSDAKDAGDSLSSFSQDANGVTRPQGLAWDIGALEYFVLGKKSISPYIFNLLME